MFGRGLSLGEFGTLILTMVGVFSFYVLLPASVLYWLFSKTRMGKNLRTRNRPAEVTLAAVDQLRTMQAQLDEVHSRLDFAERVMAEQREQLRALGAQESYDSERDLTPT